jgi:hypothetical protein
VQEKSLTCGSAGVRTYQLGCRPWAVRRGRNLLSWTPDNHRMFSLAHAGIRRIFPNFFPSVIYLTLPAPIPELYCQAWADGPSMRERWIS